MGSNYLLFDVAYCLKLQKKHYFKQIYADTIQLGEIIHKISMLLCPITPNTVDYKK